MEGLIRSVKEASNHPFEYLKESKPEQKKRPSGCEKVSAPARM
jgi:hypothetical protein